MRPRGCDRRIAYPLDPPQANPPQAGLPPRGRRRSGGTRRGRNRDEVQPAGHSFPHARPDGSRRRRRVRRVPDFRRDPDSRARRGDIVRPGPGSTGRRFRRDLRFLGKRRGGRRHFRGSISPRQDPGNRLVRLDAGHATPVRNWRRDVVLEPASLDPSRHPGSHVRVGPALGNLCARHLATLRSSAKPEDPEIRARAIDVPLHPCLSPGNRLPAGGGYVPGAKEEQEGERGGRTRYGDSWVPSVFHCGYRSICSASPVRRQRGRAERRTRRILRFSRTSSHWLPVA